MTGTSWSSRPRDPILSCEFNGVKTVDFEDPAGPRTGRIIFQQHSGTANWVMFKDVEILEE